MDKNEILEAHRIPVGQKNRRHVSERFSADLGQV